MKDNIKAILTDLIGADNKLEIISINILVIIMTIIISILIIIIIVKICIFINHRITRRYLAKISKVRAVTITTMIDNIIKYTIGIMGIFMMLINLGFDATLLLTGAGAGAVIVGFAAQELIKDFINGLFTVIEGYYDIGDYIEVNAYEGTVIDLGIKTTTLRTNENYIVTLPNSLITEIKNLSKTDINVFYDINTSYEVQVKKIENLITSEILPLFRNDELVHTAEYLGVSGLNESSVSHMVTITCRPIDRYQVKRNLNLIIKEQFEKNNIEIPYNKISVYEGENE